MLYPARQRIGRAATQAPRESKSPELASILTDSGELSPTDVATAAILGDSFAAELLARSGRLIGTTIAPHSATPSIRP